MNPIHADSYRTAVLEQWLDAVPQSNVHKPVEHRAEHLRAYLKERADRTIVLGKCHGDAISVTGLCRELNIDQHSTYGRATLTNLTVHYLRLMGFNPVIIEIHAQKHIAYDLFE